MTHPTGLTSLGVEMDRLVGEDPEVTAAKCVPAA